MLRHIGARVRGARTARGLSPGSLAELAMLTEAELRDIEAGTTRGSAEALLSVAQVLRVELAFFFQAEHPPRPTAPMAARMAVDGLAGLPVQEAVLVAEAFARISDPAKRRKMLDMVRAVADAEAPRPAPRVAAPRH
ncbi:helix-turn-helix domain-containing protein [Roseomonas sp. HF4]|uniref:helix-turn-helix domain-containing protein n=1 Tax=Roseomonas sp. HF4 TaxID=2562313 RepID=UPI001484D8B6|nr:helix-turn-helix transcriptional regulator [Roseomonas sp. HF4]